MASLKFYLDTRYDAPQLPIKISVSHNQRVAHINIGVKVAAKEWDKKSEMVINRPDADRLNRYLANQMAAYTNALFDVRSERSLTHVSATELRQFLIDIVTPPDDQQVNFMTIFDKFTGERPALGTRKIYARTAHAIRQFDKNAERLKFEDITVGWLRDYEAYLSENSNANTISIHLRNIRAVINYAITEGLTEHYPFRRFKIKQGAVVKRSLTVEQLRKYIFAEGLPPHEARYRDYFTLIFLLIGINTVDLYGLTEITDEGRIEYDRAKTGKHYSIKVEPEAMELIERMRGRKKLLFVADGYKNYVDHRAKLNLSIRRVCKSLGLPEATTYWARHTWATIAHSLDVPVDTIAQALGHDFGNQTTAIYINPNREKVDAANRKVIDWVYYGKR
jgi:integrase